MEKGFGRLHVQKEFSLPSMDGAWSWAAYSISLKACVRKIDTIMMRSQSCGTGQWGNDVLFLHTPLKQLVMAKMVHLAGYKVILVTSNVDLAGFCYFEHEY